MTNFEQKMSPARSEREIKEALDRAGYSFNPETDFDDYSENLEGGSRDLISNAAIKAFHKEQELKARTLETSDMLYGDENKVNKIVLPKPRRDAGEGPDS